MNKELNFYLADIIDHSIEELVNVLEISREVDFNFPPDYTEFMQGCNGGDGEVGENSWLCLFLFQNLVETNKNYVLLMQQIPDYFLIGKDAADTGYAFHKYNHTFHSFGLMSDFETDGIEFCGNSFVEFAKYLYEQPE